MTDGLGDSKACTLMQSAACSVLITTLQIWIHFSKTTKTTWVSRNLSSKCYSVIVPLFPCFLIHFTEKMTLSYHNHFRFLGPKTTGKLTFYLVLILSWAHRRWRLHHFGQWLHRKRFTKSPLRKDYGFSNDGRLNLSSKTWS